jgi:hypothetical protein
MVLKTLEKFVYLGMYIYREPSITYEIYSSVLKPVICGLGAGKRAG